MGSICLMRQRERERFDEIEEYDNEYDNDNDSAWLGEVGGFCYNRK